MNNSKYIFRVLHTAHLIICDLKCWHWFKPQDELGCIAGSALRGALSRTPTTQRSDICQSTGNVL